jgi:hypothetical protein
VNLKITPRAAALTIRADPALERAFRVSGTGPGPKVSEQGDEVVIGYSLGGRLRALTSRRGSLDVALSPAVPWAIQLIGGVAGLRAALREARVSEFVISGGASGIEVDLPRPQGRLAVRVEGGLSQATVRRPAGVPVSVEIAGGAAHLRLDDVEVRAAGGNVLERTPGDADGEGEIAVRVLGGASGLTVAT